LLKAQGIILLLTVKLRTHTSQWYRDGVGNDDDWWGDAA